MTLSVWYKPSIQHSDWHRVGRLSNYWLTGWRRRVRRAHSWCSYQVVSTTGQSYLNRFHLVLEVSGPFRLRPSMPSWWLPPFFLPSLLDHSAAFSWVSFFSWVSSCQGHSSLWESVGLCLVKASFPRNLPPWCPPELWQHWLAYCFKPKTFFAQTLLFSFSFIVFTKDLFIIQLYHRKFHSCWNMSFMRSRIPDFSPLGFLASCIMPDVLCHAQQTPVEEMNVTTS